MKIKRVMTAPAAVVNLEEAVAFFRDVLGAKIGPEMPHGEHWGIRLRAAWLGTEEPYRLELIEGVNDELPQGRLYKKLAPRYVSLSLEVEDIDEAITELRARGIKVADKVDVVPQGFDRLGFEGTLYWTAIPPSSACGLGIGLNECKGKRPLALEW